MATLSDDIAVTLGGAPVQIEGRLIDGRWFYFRARHEHATLSASPHGDVAAIEAIWDNNQGVCVRRDLSHLGEYGASWIPVPDALALLSEMAAELPD